MNIINDDIIGDIIPLKIDACMSVATLSALEASFYLRLQLAQVSDYENVSFYEDRFGNIAMPLFKKYTVIKTLNEKIEILEHLFNRLWPSLDSCSDGSRKRTSLKKEKHQATGRILRPNRFPSEAT